MRGVSSVGLRSLRRNLGRFGLTLAGIALGVGLFVGVIIADASARGALDDLGGRGNAETLVVEGLLGGDVSAAAVERVSHLPDVAQTNRVIRAVGRVDPPGPVEPVRVELSANEFVPGPAAGHQRPIEPDQRTRLRGRQPAAGRDELVLGGPRAAERIGADVGQQVRLEVEGRTHVFTVSGAFDEPNEAEAPADVPVFGSTRPEVLRRIVDKPDAFSYAIVALRAGADVTDWLSTHGDVTSLGARVSRFGYWNSDLEDLVGVLGSGSLGLGFVSLFIGGYLVHLTLSMTVVERTRLYGTLRAIGAARHQVRRLVLAEASGMAALGTAAGVGLGVVAGWGMTRFVASVFAVPVPHLVVPPFALIGAVVLGVLVTLVGAFVPGRRAARLSPVEAIRGGGGETRRSKTWIAGSALIGIGTLLTLFVPGRRGVDISAMLILAGTVFAVPVVVGPVAGLAGRLTRRTVSGVGDVAVLHLAKERSRSGAILALVMAVLAMTFAGAITHRSWRDTLDRTIDQRFPADLAVGGPDLDPAVSRRVRSIPGVQGTTDLRFGFAEVRGTGATSLALTVIDPATFFAVQRFPWVDGSDGEARAALADGGTVLVPEGLSRRFHARRGETITITTGHGPRPFQVAGVYATVESIKRVVIGLPDAERWFGVGPPVALAVRVGPGQEAGRVAALVRSRLSDTNVFVEETSVSKAAIKTGMDRFFNLIYALLLVMVVVGLLGLANTLVVSVTRRTREIGVMRAVGTQRRQVAGMVLVESATLCVVALAAALPVGIALATSILRSAPSALDVVVDLTVPWAALVVVAVLATVIALVAAIGPARRAARLDPVTALRFD